MTSSERTAERLFKAVTLTNRKTAGRGFRITLTSLKNKTRSEQGG